MNRMCALVVVAVVQVVDAIATRLSPRKAAQYLPLFLFAALAYFMGEVSAYADAFTIDDLGVDVGAATTAVGPKLTPFMTAALKLCAGLMVIILGLTVAKKIVWKGK